MRNDHLKAQRSDPKRQRLSSLELERFLARTTRSGRGIVRALRRRILNTVPETAETLLWESISYHLPELHGKVRGSVCLICLRDDRVRLDFIHGIHLPDTAHLLEGRLVSKRFVWIGSIEQANRPEIEALIAAAGEWPTRHE